MAISQTDVPWLQRLLQVQLRNGAGINTIIRHIEEAIEQGYKPRGYSNDAYDLALLIYRIGGANLLYAIDEIALKEAVVYFPSKNGVGGLCWKHGHNVDPILNTYESAIHIASKLESGHVHIGKEMTVIVAHLFGEDETYPIVAAPTCKEENHSNWEKLMEKLIDGWQSSGAEETVGPLWSFATNGNATCRKASHCALVRNKLDKSSSLFGVLADIPGLNLYTGKDTITLDFDYKHIFKCMVYSSLM